MLVLTEASTADAVRLDDACRSRRAKESGEGGGGGAGPSPIAFIRADTRGVFASVFTDFGDSFVVDDVDGEEPATGIGERERERQREKERASEKCFFVAGETRNSLF